MKVGEAEILQHKHWLSGLRKTSQNLDISLSILFILHCTFL